MSSEVPWFERKLSFGYPPDLLPYFLERLSGTGVRLVEKVRNVPNNVLSKRPNNKWSIKENIGHLAEVDVIANKRIDEIISGVDVMSPAVFEPHDYNPWPIEKVLSYFFENRQKNIEKYLSLPESQLTKVSVHPRLKVKMTPVDLAWFDAEHDDHHLVKINEIIKTLS